MDVVARYKSGADLRQIAAEAGCSHETVRQRLLRAGVALRSRQDHGGRKPRPTSLTDELLTDLAQWPEGATMDQLTEWFGDRRPAIVKALLPLLADGRISIRLTPSSQDAAA